ncbi:Calx-beta domain-containing protein [Sphingomonas sp. ZT3P38]|uniref:Calx-beta domain-containing protein n=1 Tax=Parasphingomonas zepuensis TaxID=3096161 RepID=UPI002FC8BD01
MNNIGSACTPNRWRRGVSLSIAAMFAGGVATVSLANETMVYTYDPLGRLVSVTIAGGPRNGQQVSTGFDPADNRTNYQVAGAPSGTFSVADANITEGGSAIVTITRSGSVSGVAAVNYATSNNSATAPADYTAASGTVTFAAGETSKTISIATADDSVYEGPEAFAVTLSGPTAGAGLGKANAIVTIIDNETVPELAISNATVTEGGSAVLTVTRSSVTGSTVAVNYATANGTATAPGDFVAASGTLTFLAGETSKTITVATVNDTVHEASESFAVGLSGATGGAIITNATGRVSVADNDTAPSFAISNATATEGGSLVMTVTKTGSTAATLSVTYQTVNGTAVAPGDYGAVSGTLTFLPGETSKTVTVASIDDAIYDPGETLSVRLSGASGGATIATATGTGTINDNDAMPSFSVSNVSVNEGDFANLTVVKSGATGVNATVSYATADGSASQSLYQSANGSLTFLPGETTKTVQVRTTHDVSFDVRQTFTVGLSGPSAATIGAPIAIVSINNIDPPPSFTAVTPTQKNEGSLVEFGVVLTGNPYYKPPLTIYYTTSSGTATSGTDFTPVSGTLTFNSPSSVQSVLVQTTQDSDVEPDETIIFTISSPSYGAGIVTGQVSGTIKNDDIPPSTGPVANTDNMGSFSRCDTFTITPLSNDTDPGGHYPLTLVSVATGNGYSAVVSGNTVYFTVFGVGTRNVQYVVANSAGGQATGIITFSVASGPICI